MLTVRDKMTLDLAARRSGGPGARETEIRVLFSERPTAFYQRLNRLIDDPEALAYAPLTVKRLLRLRDQRRAVRRYASSDGTTMP
jgi:hypothetical protein